MKSFFFFLTIFMKLSFTNVFAPALVLHLKMGIIKSKGDEKVLENLIVFLLYEHIFLGAKHRMAES